MATDTPLLWRQRLLAAKVETTTGTPVTFAAADAAFNVNNHELEIDSPFNERKGQSSLSPLQGVPGEEGGHYNFQVELAASGVSATPTPAWATVLLAGCGFVATTNTFTPQTGAATTLTMGLYNSGRLKQLAGAQGNVNFKLVDGKIGVADFKFLGKWVAPSSAAMLAPTYPTAQPPKCTGLTLTIGGTSYRVNDVEIDMGIHVYLRKDMTDPSGYHSAFIVDRKPTVKVDIEALPLTTQDFYAMRHNNTTAAFSCAIGTGAGNIVTIACPVLTLGPGPKDKNLGETVGDSLQFEASRNGAAGDDEISIAFS